MSDAPATTHLSGDEVRALRFAAQRQLTRLANNPRLNPEQHTTRNALKRAVAVLHDRAFAHGCELHAADPDAQP